MNSSDLDAEGVYLVETESASYVLDLAEGTSTRYPQTESFTGPLRKDGVPVPLISVLRCALGAPLTLVLVVSDEPDVVTVREATLVQRIERVR